MGARARALWPALTAGLVGVMFGAMLLAPLADRFGRRVVIIWSRVAFGLCTLLTVAVDSLAALAVVRRTGPTEPPDPG
jgi:AAHS family 4-hydroxybenzoate transporter-like MFS transporter